MLLMKKEIQSKFLYIKIPLYQSIYSGPLELYIEVLLY